MGKPTCICGEAMTFLMDNKRYAIWECKKNDCGRLLLQPKHNEMTWGHNLQLAEFWYVPEPKERR